MWWFLYSNKDATTNNWYRILWCMCFPNVPNCTLTFTFATLIIYSVGNFFYLFYSIYILYIKNFNLIANSNNKPKRNLFKWNQISESFISFIFMNNRCPTMLGHFTFYIITIILLMERFFSLNDHLNSWQFYYMIFERLFVQCSVVTNSIISSLKL